MHLTPSDYVLWVAGTGLRILLCTFLLRNRTFRQLPFFSIFIFLSTAWTLSFWWIYHDPTIEPGIILNAYWFSQFTQVIARGLAVAEICWLVLGAHRGIWKLTWRLLAGVGMVLVASAAMAAIESPAFFAPVVLRGERGLELTVIGLLVALLAVCRYYGIRMQSAVRWLALGLGLYALIQTANNTFLYDWFNTYFPMWGKIRVLSFDIALAIWSWGLRQPVLLTRPDTELLDRGVYEQVVPQVSYRLQELNARLLEMLK